MTTESTGSDAIQRPALPTLAAALRLDAALVTGVALIAWILLAAPGWPHRPDLTWARNKPNALVTVPGDRVGPDERAGYGRNIEGKEP